MKDIRNNEIIYSFIKIIYFSLRKLSIRSAHLRPSLIAQTTSDCPLLQSPATKTLSDDVLKLIHQLQHYLSGLILNLNY